VHIDLLDPESFDGSQPHDQFRWLRENAPVYRPRVRALARQIVDAVCEKGRCDLVGDIAGEMPSYVIAELMGLPLHEGRELYRLTETIHADPSAVSQGAQAAAVLRMFNRAHELAQEKRARPGSDLASRILRAEVDGKKLDDIDFNLFFLLLVDAGGDTTRNLVGAGLLALFEHPEQRAHLARDLRSRLPCAVEEMLRFTSPVIYMRRTATREVELGGHRIRKGDKVVMYYGANRDPAVFERAEHFDGARHPNHHVAFGGGGAHFCLGSHLARVEIVELLDEVLRRLPDLELDGPVERLPSTFISGPSCMPVRFTPSAPSGQG
jgi:cytochrome P450